jgi:hypothetical protein
MAPPRAPQMGRLQEGGDYVVCRQVMQARRRAGDPFDVAWEAAMQMVKREDRAVLEDTKHAWHECYHRRPTYSGKAFSTLANELDPDAGQRHDQRILA